LRQDQLVQRQIGHRLAKPFVLLLEILQLPKLVTAHAAILLAPPVERQFGNADLANGNAIAMPWPRKTSTCRSFVTISSGLCRLFAIVVLLHGQNHTSRWTRSMGVDQFRMW